MTDHLYRSKGNSTNAPSRSSSSSTSKSTPAKDSSKAKADDRPKNRTTNEAASTKKQAKPSTSTNSKPNALHPRNVHQGRYDFEVLTKALPELAKHTITNPNGEPTINFSDSKAVLTLNKALLSHHYGVKHWDLPEGYLCPPIPGRADYIHQVADLLAEDAADEEIKNKQVNVLDIGTGANLIYPIVGSQSYGWHFTATDIDTFALSTATAIVKLNPNLKKLITVKKQPNPDHIFKGVIEKGDYFDLTVCNPPFHASMQEVLDTNRLKQEKLRRNRERRARQSSPTNSALKNAKPNKAAEAETNLNFGGQNSELWTAGGEVAFVSRMIKESTEYANQVNWFTTLISKAEHLKPLDTLLRNVGAAQIRTINMQHGQKMTRILAWRFS